MNPARRGSAYVLVLGASMLIVTVGVSAVMIGKQGAGVAASRADALRARAGALSGMSMALESADQETSWRTTHASFPKCMESTAGGVDIEVLVSDPTDGVLDDDWTDPVRLRAESSVGTGSRIYQATFRPVIRDVKALSHALCAGGDLLINSGSFDALGTIAAGGVIRVRTPDAHATAWQVLDSVEGLAGRESVIRLSSAPELPESCAIESLAALATVLPTTDISGVVLSDNLNPWGRPTRSGVYVIDCRGGSAHVTGARIRSTLVFVNADRGVRIDGSVSLESANPGMPALVVDGPCVISMSGADLSESEQGVNFNPVGAPFENTTDNDRRDTYGSMISGAMWVRGDLRIQGDSFTCEGVVMADGDVVVDASVVLRHIDMNTKLRGFAVRERWSQVDGSFARVTE